MTTFDPDEIMNLQTEGEMETRMPPIPEGEFSAYIKEVDVRTGTSSKTGNPYAILDVSWAITDESVASEVGISEPVARQSIFLDFNDNGGLAMGPGKNLGLGRLREAVGQNGPGAWSMGQLEGASAIVRVAQREYEGNIYADVKSAVAA
jgi:hypothetical protein